MTFALRAEVSDDAAAIREVLLAAFPTSAEADLVEQLRQDGDCEISLVAEEEGRITGHVLMSRMRVEGDGRSFQALGLAPLAVLPECQHQGIGSGLIRAALAIARRNGEELIFVLGAPAYYGRFGFSAEDATPFASPYAGPFLMAQCLGEIELPAHGRADYARGFAAFE